ncbi:MAG: divalent-cation tolerance protein CutA [Pseudomonadaceae bacterium]|nr:divalent-cation tolerance protein CutA [Pseudomonadaceae bacterium]
MSGYLIVFTTCDSQQCAEAITETLLQNRLAACVQQGGTRSHYIWQGEQQQAEEITLTIKTRAALWEKVEAAIRANHTYDTPEIIAWSVSHGHAPYLNWINEVTA